MQVMARACDHDRLSKFSLDDLTTWKKDIAELSWVMFGWRTATPVIILARLAGTFLHEAFVPNWGACDTTRLHDLTS
jgi:hypothetical protein